MARQRRPDSATPPCCTVGVAGWAHLMLRLYQQRDALESAALARRLARCCAWNESRTSGGSGAGSAP
jgi:hypothetical protein